MKSTKDSNYKLVLRRAVTETLLLALVVLLALALFIASIYFIAAREAEQELQNRPWGLFLGWLTIITVGLVLGRTRQKEKGILLPKSVIVIQESLQVTLLLLFFGMLSYASYWVYTTRALIVHRPWGILIGWFAFLIFIAFFVKARHLVRFARRK